MMISNYYWVYLVICGRNISSDGGAIIFTCGIWWSKEPSPTTIENLPIDSSGIEIFSSSLTNGMIFNRKSYI